MLDKLVARLSDIVVNVFTGLLLVFILYPQAVIPKVNVMERFASVNANDAVAWLGKLLGTFTESLINTITAPLIQYETRVWCMRQPDPIKCIETFRNFSNYTEY